MESSADVEHDWNDGKLFDTRNKERLLIFVAQMKGLTAKRKTSSETETGQKRRKTARAKATKLCDYFQPTGLFETSNSQTEDCILPPAFRPSRSRDDAVQQLADSAVGGAGFNQAACLRHQKLVYGSSPTCFLEDGTFKVPGMETTLPVYQLAGCAFMLEREQSPEPLCGGICADAMGLGKTVQILACSVNDWETRKKQPPTLIVVKSHLVQQWYQEIQKHCQQEACRDILQFYADNFKGQTGVMKKLQDNKFVITTYKEVLDSHAAYKKTKSSKPSCGLLHRVYFHRIILDEIQQIKNGDSKTSLACVALKGKHRWGLSATPISNRVDELWPICRFLRVDCTEDKKTFRKAYKIKHGTVVETGPLQRLLNELMIHRNYQTEIAGRKLLTIPRPSRYAIKPNMTKTEQAVYTHTEICLRAGVAVLLKKSQSGEQRKTAVLKLLLNLRGMSTHILMQYKTVETCLSESLIKSIQKFADDADEQPWVAYITKMFNKSKKPRDRTSILTPDISDRLGRGQFTKAEIKELFNDESWMNDLEAPLESAKIKAAKQQVREWIKQDPSIKVLVFTLFIQSSEIMMESLKRVGIESRLYNGKQNHHKRAAEKEEFDNDPNIHVLIATMQSMSLGLNCQNASAVVLVDRWWNSTVEEQAIGRAYRMNQTKSVQIRDLIVLGSFDERIKGMQERKRAMIRSVFGRDRHNDKSLTNNDYMDLIGSENTYDDIPDPDAQAYANALMEMGKDDHQGDTDDDSALFDMESIPDTQKEIASFFTDAMRGAIAPANAPSDETYEPEDDELDQLIKSNVGIANRGDSMTDTNVEEASVE
ncbi:MAG: hypothetical protein M1831_001560 [Alyxoria varia]|nr:MAG: hypothetical protein M1831_001560 [Alyxoria varia]